MISSNMSFEHSQYDDHDDGLFDADTLGICKNARLTTSIDDFAKDRRSGTDDEEWHIAQMFNK